jgi:hypothetical protein
MLQAMRHQSTDSRKNVSNRNPNMVSLTRLTTIITGLILTKLESQLQRMVGDPFLNGQSKKLLINVKVLIENSEPLTRLLIIHRPMIKMRQTEMREWKKLL